MYKSKPYQPAHNSKDIFTLYILGQFFFLHIKYFKSYGGLNVTAFYFKSHRSAKNTMLMNFKRK